MSDLTGAPDKRSKQASENPKRLDPSHKVVEFFKEIKIKQKWNILEEQDADLTRVAKSQKGRLEATDDGKRRFVLDLKDLPSETIKRQEILYELITTERDYLTDLERVTEVCT